MEKTAEKLILQQDISSSAYGKKIYFSGIASKIKKIIKDTFSFSEPLKDTALPKTNESSVIKTVFADSFNENINKESIQLSPNTRQFFLTGDIKELEMIVADTKKSIDFALRLVKRKISEHGYNDKVKSMEQSISDQKEELTLMEIQLEQKKKMLLSGSNAALDVSMKTDCIEDLSVEDSFILSDGLRYSIGQTITYKSTSGESSNYKILGRSEHENPGLILQKIGHKNKFAISGDRLSNVSHPKIENIIHTVKENNDLILKPEITSMEDNALIIKSTDNESDKCISEVFQDDSNENQNMARNSEINKENLSSGKKGISDTLANLGFRSSEIKNKFFSFLLDKAKDTVKANEIMSLYFEKYSEIYEKERKSMDLLQKETSKTKMMKFSGISKGVLDILKYGRVLYDVVDTVSFRSFNPFRNITALSMLAGRSAQVAKETRLSNKHVIERTRIKDESKAHDEAWQIYNHAMETKGDFITSEDITMSYKRSLIKNLQKRLENLNSEKTGFLGSLFRGDTRKYIKRMKERIKKINNSRYMTRDQKIENIGIFLKKNDDLLSDLDRMVGSDGTVDNIAYCGRIVEKVAKSVASLLTLDSIGRLAYAGVDAIGLVEINANPGQPQMTPIIGIHEYSKDYSDNDFGRTPYVYKTDINSIVDSIKMNQLFSSFENNQINEINNAQLTDIDRINEDVISKNPSDSVISDIPNENMKSLSDIPVSDLNDIDIINPETIRITKGYSVWKVLSELLSGNKDFDNNEFISKVIRTIESDPKSYGLYSDDINIVSIDDLKGMKWKKAIIESI
ncbi:MAG: hypothetical protein PHS92_02915 [Candidatus Gracilibacteria bacterium]|nr:hypothetical protein [Candidatus Gracilibacteria bacterium]